MFYLQLFIGTFIFIVIIYYFYYILFSRRGRKCPTEATYIVKLYKLDINKFSYRKFLWHVACVSALDIAIVAVVVTIFDKMIWQILFGIITVLPVITISFTLLGKYYQKKQLKDNTKELLKEERKIKKQEKFESTLFDDEHKFKLFRRKKKGKNKNDKHK